ncbi:MAG: hypothetical protein GOVbin4296_59 [Prokaryotic dsDNA virus sp.]|nr:MAG: hypothetical protein GOVbin4296_59 [Prokaryotic dsDNA virus sp.]|tara:strand:- start:11178 stop:12959 length:1782 start_codon:yes stop_codon:yes gene_type:complete
MAFVDDVSALTQHTFGASTVPSQDDLSSILKVTAKEIYQRIKIMQPLRVQDFQNEVLVTASTTLSYTGVTASAATPSVFTKTGHSLQNGDWVTLSGFTGTAPEQINGITAQVENSAANTFTLKGVYCSNALADGVVVRSDFASSFTPDSLEIQYILRLDHSTGRYYNATKMSTGQLAGVEDPLSENYRTPQFPGYVVKGGSIWIYPSPSAQDKAVVGLAGFDNSLAYNSTDVAYFPKDLEHALVLGASMKTAQALISDVIINGMPNEVVMPSFPSTPVLSSLNYNDFASVSVTVPHPAMPTAPEYISNWANITEFSIGAVAPAAPTPPTFTHYDVQQAVMAINSFLTTAPEFDSTSLNTADVASKISDDDPELAGIEIQKLSADTNIQVQEFTEQTTQYQAELQLKLQELNILGQKYQKESDQKFNAQLQEFQSELSIYQQNITRYQAEVSKEIQEWQIGQLQRYTNQIQDNSAKFQEENTKYQAEMQKMLQTYQGDLQIAIKNGDALFQQRATKAAKDFESLVAGNTEKIQKYSQEIQAWSGRVSGLVGKYSAEGQVANQKLQGYQALYKNLLEQYMTAFVAPQPAPQGNRR